MRDAPWHISVLIPARDEEDLIARCISSVQSACAAVQSFAKTDIVIAVDHSTDRTHTIARRMLFESDAVVTTQSGNVGEARALAASIALRRWTGRRDHCWIANTDADSEVPQSWLTDQIALANNGFQAIAGTVNVDTFAEHNPIVRDLFHTTYLLAADGSHSHVHGANLGVRADTYLAAGGWPGLPSAEDHALWRRLGAIGAPRVSVSHICVTTSGRRIGRAPHGFAQVLAAHNEPQQ